MRKIYMRATVELVVCADDEVTMGHLSDNVEIRIRNTDTEDKFDIESWDIESWKIVDSK